jgi:hypothetical protein
MTLQDMGAIGEFIGALLLFGSLIYVAVQIRQNTSSQRAQIRQDWANIVIGWNRYLIENSELRKTLRQGANDGFKDLDDNQSEMVVLYFQSSLWTFSTFYHHHLNGLIDEGTWHEVESLIDRYAKNEAFREYWPIYEDQMAPSFRSFFGLKISSRDV